MRSEAANPNKRVSLNPNWDQLREKIRSRHPKPSEPSSNSDKQNLRSVLGKRKDITGAVSEDSPVVSVLIPTSTDFSLTDAVAMDCEMVGVTSEGNKSALGRVTLVNAWGNILYDEYVRPIDRIVDFRTEISGIRPRDLRKAKDFQFVQKKVAELIKGKILVGHSLHNDFKALFLSHPKKDIRDTSEFAPFLKEGRKRALRHLAAEFLGVKIQHGEHNPIEDARAAMLLYQKNKKKWEKSVKEHLKFKKKQMKRKPKKKPKERDNVNPRKKATVP